MGVAQSKKVLFLGILSPFRYISRFLYYHIRLFSYLPAFPIILYFRFKRTIIGLFFYAIVSRNQMWRRAINKFFAFGMESSPAKVVSKLSQPLSPSSEKRYLILLHPHGILADGLHAARMKNPHEFDDDNINTFGIENLNLHFCFGDAVQYVPL